MSANQFRIFQNDHKARTLWITPPRCASLSIRGALGLPEGHRDDAKRDYRTICFIRHPYDRLVSALHHRYLMTDEPFADRVKRYCFPPDNWHVKPVTAIVEGFRIDEWRRYDRPGFLIDHSRRGEHPAWQDIEFDWSIVEPIYREDMRKWQLLM